MGTRAPPCSPQIFKEIECDVVFGASFEQTLDHCPFRTRRRVLDPHLTKNNPSPKYFA